MATENDRLYKFHKAQWYNKAGIDFKEIEPHIRNFEKMDQLLPHGPRFYLILNLNTYQYEFLGNGQFALSGYDNEFVKQQGIKFQMAQIHPEDGKYVVEEGYENFAKVVMSQPVEERMDILLQTNYRFKHKDGHYIHLVEQTWVMKLDDAGNLHMMLTHVYQLESLPGPFLGNIVIKKLNKDKSYKTIYSKTYPDKETDTDVLSKREKEVVRLLAIGLKSHEIAENLNISYNTVRTHRRNILKKLNLTSGGVVAYAVLNNLI